MPATLKKLAQELNLSTATVSRVLSGRGRELVSPQTQERVLRVARQRKFRPNPVARALVIGRTQTIGVLTFTIYPAHYTQILCHIQEIVHNAGYHVQINETLNLVPSAERMRQLSSWPVDGLLAFDSPATLMALRDAGVTIPAVCLGTAVVHPDSGMDSVWIDAYPAVSSALSDLIRQGGVRRLAMLGLPSTDPESPTDARYRAYRETVAGFGLEPEYIDIPYMPTTPLATWSHQASELLRRRKFVTRAQVARYVREHGCPDAIFCSTDDMAVGSLRGLLDLGIRSPRDVLILGFDGIEEGIYQYVELSTVALPERKLCEEAWRLLRRRIDAPDAPAESVTLYAESLPRGSSTWPEEKGRKEEKTKAWARGGDGARPRRPAVERAER